MFVSDLQIHFRRDNKIFGYLATTYYNMKRKDEMHRNLVEATLIILEKISENLILFATSERLDAKLKARIFKYGIDGDVLHVVECSDS